jgi:hypothetical protein
MWEYRPYPLFSASLFAAGALVLLAAALADTVWHSRATSELIGWPGMIAVGSSIVLLWHSAALDEADDCKAIARSKYQPWINDEFF